MAADAPQLVHRVGIEKDADERLNDADDGPELRIVRLAGEGNMGS